jgi:hypothetical protein
MVTDYKTKIEVTSRREDNVAVFRVSIGDDQAVAYFDFQNVEDATSLFNLIHKSEPCVVSFG